MIKIKSNCIVYIIAFCFIAAFPSYGGAQNTDEQKIIAAATEISKPTIKKENQTTKIENEKNDASAQKSGIFNFKSDSDALQENQTNEDKQAIMEKALELLEIADEQWGKGDIEETLDTLDEAYSLMLDANGDVAVAQEKDDLRLLIARRILAVYSSKKTVVNGKNGEIPLIMNADVEKEIRSFQGLERDYFIAAYQRSGMYRSAILKELKKAGIPEEFLWLPLVESFFKINAYSRARALGLWQFIPSTGYKFGLNRDEWIDERMDVQKSTKAAIAYLKELHNMFGDWLTALAAYNCGEGRVLRVISRQQINYLDGFWDLYRQLPNETARYVPRFLATIHIVNNPQKYGFDLSREEKPIEFETVKVNKVMKLKDIGEKIEISEEVLSLLNPELRHKMTPDREYELKLPEDSLNKFNVVCNDIPESEKPSYVSVQATRKAFIRHRVKRGETIYSIARKYHVSVSSIRSYNKLRSKTRLVQGRRITIPIAKKEYLATDKSTKKNSKKQVSSSERYKVKKGDTLMMISRRFSVPVNQLKEINNLKTGSIRVGQNLKILRNSEEAEADADAEDDAVKNKNVKKSSKKSTINKKVLSSSDIDKLGTNKYIVTKNDSLHSIARKNNTNIAKLMELNKISMDEKLIPGQILTIK
ncbi:MAG: LysM peptidoglycan-binding domain-containing protein [Deltaproteobacteria bacterium]|nr:LysM peptidoglycan-binding domain-containing protein [Deltaproteobacteria bacterium]